MQSLKEDKQFQHSTFLEYTIVALIAFEVTAARHTRTHVFTLSHTLSHAQLISQRTSFTRHQVVVEVHALGWINWPPWMRRLVGQPAKADGTHDDGPHGGGHAKGSKAQMLVKRASSGSRSGSRGATAQSVEPA
jgi:hypothetical protein